MYEVTKASGGVNYYGLAMYYQIPCDCSRCLEQYRSVQKQQSKIMCLYTGEMSISETEHMSQSFCTRLFEDLGVVRSLLISHGELVRTRWLHKPNYKRRKILTQIKGDMYATEDAFIEILNDEKICPDDMSTRDFRDVFLLPYMTVETFATHGSRLLRLLHHRTFHPPEEWATFDNRQLHAGWSVYALEEKICPGCITMHGKDYGKWTPFDAKAVHNGDSYGAPRALLILEAQSLLARFLRNFMTSMVANIEKLDPQQAPTEYAQSIALPDIEETSGVNPSIKYYNQPFSPPPIFNNTTIDELLEIVSRKQAETQDHLWLLQTDCTYFHNCACYWKEHNTTAFGVRAEPKSTTADAFGIRLICSPLWHVLEWQHLAENLRSVRQVYEARREDIAVGQPLPKDYAEALEYLQTLVLVVLEDRIFQLKELTIVSPHLRSKWEVVAEPGLNDVTFMRLKDDGSNKFNQLHKTDQILHCLMALCEGTMTRQNWDMALVLKSLDLYLAKCGTKEARKIDPIVDSKTADIAAMYRILTAVRMHRPKPPLLYTLSTEIPSKTGKGTLRIWPYRDKLKELFENPRSFHFRQTLDSLDKFKIPKGEKNEQWLDRADSAHRALSQVWSSAREDYERVCRSLNIRNVDTEDVVQLLSYHDSPDVLAAAARERQEIVAHILESATRKGGAVNKPVLYESTIPHVPALITN